jgi:hypothetical protein
MIFGTSEILICLVPVFLIIFVIGVVLLVRNRSAGSKKERK